MVQAAVVVVNEESVNTFDGKLDHYLRENRGFK